MSLLLLKGFGAGVAAGTIVTYGMITFLPRQGQSDALDQARTGLSQTSTGAGVGGLIGLVWAAADQRRRRRAPWQGWRRFVVERKHPESAEITSFEFRPADGGPLPAYLAGQFLTLELQIPGVAKPVLRTYSLSDFPGGDRAPDHYRISVKREPAPKGLDVPPGLASNFLHDHIKEGTTLNLRPPAGSFVLDTASSEPIVLVSNGVGITPMLAMLKAALAQSPERQIWFVHGCRNSEHHAFRADVETLSHSHPNLHLHVAYSRPLTGDEGHYQSQGYVDGALLQQLIKEPAAYYLCGSPAFMDSLVMALEQRGVQPAAIRFERFSQAPRVTPPTAETPVNSCEVHFCRSNRRATWDGSHPDQSLLELSEATGLRPAFACRAGVCGTCTTRVTSGKVTYLTDPTAEVAPGTALICIARPASQTLELDQ
jgi:ferredoxin-NADP reductase